MCRPPEYARVCTAAECHEFTCTGGAHLGHGILLNGAILLGCFFKSWALIQRQATTRRSKALETVVLQVVLTARLWHHHVYANADSSCTCTCSSSHRVIAPPRSEPLPLCSKLRSDVGHSAILLVRRKRLSSAARLQLKLEVSNADAYTVVGHKS